MAISLQRSVLCKFKFITENKITSIKFSIFGFYISPILT